MSPKRRIFARRNDRTFRITLLLITLILGTVAACAPETAQWSPHQSPKRNEVRWVTFEYTARFAPGRDALSVAERDKLNAFLVRHDAGYGDQVLIGATGDRIGSDAERTAGRREAAVSAALRAANIRPRLLPKTPTAEIWDGTVRVVLGRFIVVPPQCPDWSKRADDDPSNRESSNLGCATATNLGLMVANPEDLVRGDRPGPSDGAYGARLYRNYRDGEQPAAPAITPLVIQSGVGSSGGGK